MTKCIQFIKSLNNFYFEGASYVRNQPAQERSVLANIFLAPDEPRLRAGWRLLIQTIMFLLFGVIIFIVASLLGLDSGNAPATLIFQQVLSLIAVTGSVYIARRWLDKRSFESLGLKWNQQALVDVLAGIGIAFIQMGFIYILMLGLNWLTFEGFAWEFDPLNEVILGVLIFFVIFIFVGWE